MIVYSLFQSFGNECSQIAIRAILCNQRIKKSARAAKKEINIVKSPGTVNERVARNWFEHLKERNTNLKDKPKSGRHSVVEDEGLLEMCAHQPSIIDGRNWSFIM